MKQFQDKVAAITGAGSGIGRALAVELARRRCHLALADINEAGMEETARLAANSGARITLRSLDVSRREDVEEWARCSVEEHGRVNLIFNNAGVALGARLDSVRPQDFEWIMGINFWGVVHGTQAFLPHLKASGDGHVVNVSSLFGLMAMPEQGTYNASKFAVRGYTEALRMELELAGAPVSATCIHPGGIATNIAYAARIDERLLEARGLDIETLRQQANGMLQRTTPDAAAKQILRGVERNKRRVLVGPDAWLLDKIIRLLGSSYQPVALRIARGRQGERADAPAAHPK